MVCGGFVLIIQHREANGKGTTRGPPPIPEGFKSLGVERSGNQHTGYEQQQLGEDHEQDDDGHGHQQDRSDVLEGLGMVISPIWEVIIRQVP